VRPVDREGPIDPPAIVPNDAWPVPVRRRWCGKLGRIIRRRHLDIAPDPALPGRLVCVRCGLVRYALHGRDRG